MLGIRSMAAAGVATGLAISGQLAYAAIPEPDGTISGCYTKSAGLFDAKGTVRVIDWTSQCLDKRARTHLESPGPQGPAGPAATTNVYFASHPSTFEFNVSQDTAPKTIHDRKPRASRRARLLNAAMTRFGPMTTAIGRRGDLLAIAFSVLAICGLALWFRGANMPGNTMSAAELEYRLNSRGLALAGAIVLIVAMVALLAFARWLGSRYIGNQRVALDAAVLALGGLTHLVENILVLVLYSGDISDRDTLADVIGAMSNTAFGLLGVGVLVAALGLTATWLEIWGVVTGLLGVAAAISTLRPPCRSCRVRSTSACSCG